MNKKNNNLKMSDARIGRDLFLSGMSKKILPFILGFMIIFTPPLLVLGAGLVPDCNKGEIDPVTQNYKNPCGFNALMEIVNKVINFVLIDLATPLFALILVYVGWLYLSDMGAAENKTKAKKILQNAVIGYVIALAAWLIVKTLLTSLGFTGPMFLT